MYESRLVSRVYFFFFFDYEIVRIKRRKFLDTKADWYQGFLLSFAISYLVTTKLK